MVLLAPPHAAAAPAVRSRYRATHRGIRLGVSVLSQLPRQGQGQRLRTGSPWGQTRATGLWRGTEKPAAAREALPSAGVPTRHPSRGQHPAGLSDSPWATPGSSSTPPAHSRPCPGLPRLCLVSESQSREALPLSPDPPPLIYIQKKRKTVALPLLRTQDPVPSPSSQPDPHRDHLWARTTMLGTQGPAVAHLLVPPSTVSHGAKRWRGSRKPEWGPPPASP